MTGYILAKRHSPLLAQFASSNVLVAFDYDGTLAPLVATPSRARMRASTRRLLDAVSRRYPCVVISGRSRDDVSQRIDPVPLWHVAGNHGLEPWGQKAAYVDQVREWVQRLEPRLAGLKGVAVENKIYSVAIHYRLSPRKRAALLAIRRAIKGLRGVRAIDGSEAINLVPRGAPDKGTALEHARRLLVCDTAIYVGDDDTDEDAFKAGRPERLLAIRIGHAIRSRARYRLKHQGEIDQLLQALLTLRPQRQPTNN